MLENVPKISSDFVKFTQKFRCLAILAPTILED